MGLITNSLQLSGDTYSSPVITKISTGTTTLDNDPNSLATNQVVKNYIDYGGNSGSTTGGTSSLSTSLSNEISTRGSADSSLSSAIVSSSPTGITSLSTVVSTETSTRTSGDQSLSTNISSNTSKESSLSTGISTEISNRTSGDQSLSTTISTTTSSNISLSTVVSTEVSNRTSGDSSLSTSLSTETSVVTSSDQSLSTSISTHTSTDTSTHQSLSTGVSTEISTRGSADISLSTTSQQPWIDINRCGFIDNTQTSVSFNSSTYVFTLSGLTSWSYYRAGIKCTITGNKTITLPGTPPTAGMYYITINSTDGTLISGTTAWTLLDSILPVASVQWNNGNTPKYLLADERHTSDIDRKMHAYLHLTRGTQFVDGGALDGPTLATATDLGCALGVAQTRIADDNLIETIPTFVRPSGTTNDYLILFRSGLTTYTWQMSPVPFKYTTTGFIEYDLNGVMTAGVNARWYNTYVLFLDYEILTGTTILPGRGVFTSLALAQAESPLTFDFTGFFVAEAIIAYQLTWVTATGNSNKGKVTLAATPKKINITTTSTVGSGAGTDHNTLAGLQGGDTGERYHLTNTDYITATGISATVSTEISTRTSGDQSLSTSILVKSDKALTIISTGASYTLLEADNGKMIEFTGSGTLTMPNGLSTGYQVSVMNMGSAITVTLSATTTLYTKGSKVTITSQYAGASIYHKGSNVWIAMGDLV